MEWSKWYLSSSIYKDKRRYRIRRQRLPVTKKIVWQSHKSKDFDPYCDEATAKRYVLQLNIRAGNHLKNAKVAYEIKHAFISPKLLEDFKDHLLSQVSSKEWGNAYFNGFINHGLKWFVVKNSQPDPIEWKALEDKWGRALLGRLEPKEKHLQIFDDMAHPNTIKKQLHVMNKFLNFLHKRIPKTVQSIQLEPISKAVMRDYSARYSVENKLGRFIKPEDWVQIRDKIDETIKPFVVLAYSFGLRRAESLAIKPENVRRGFLQVTEQLVHSNEHRTTYSPLKSREARKVEYWFMTASEVYNLLEALPTRLNPDVYGHKFEKEMKRLGFNYQTHDLRRTFITNAFRAGKNYRDIQLAAGHSDITTTMKYAMDDRKMSDEDIYKPEDAA